MIENLGLYGDNDFHAVLCGGGRREKRRGVIKVGSVNNRHH